MKVCAVTRAMDISGDWFSAVGRLLVHLNAIPDVEPLDPSGVYEVYVEDFGLYVVEGDDSALIVREVEEPDMSIEVHSGWHQTGSDDETYLYLQERTFDEFVNLLRVAAWFATRAAHVVTPESVG